MSNVQGKKEGIKKRARTGSFKQGTKKALGMVVAYKATNIPRNKLSDWGASPRNSVYVCHGTAYPLPDVLVNKIKVSNVIGMQTGASGAFASSQFRINDAADVFVAAGSNQPRFYDQLSALYANCTVYGAKVNLKILQGANTAARTHRVIFVPARNTTVPIADAFVDANELPGIMRFDINSTQSTALPLTEAKEKKRYYDIGSFWGKSRQQVLTEEGFSGLAGAAPTYQVYGYLCVQELGGNGTDTIYVEVSVTLYCAWTNVIAVATST